MVHKFRTMQIDVEEKRDELNHLNEADGPVFKIEKDPQVIPFIGTLLRKTSLDELPQLINVVGRKTFEWLFVRECGGDRSSGLSKSSARTQPSFKALGAL